MARPFDAALKDLIETYPADWLPLAGLKISAPIGVIDADVSAITAAADKVLTIKENPSWLLHFELQSSREIDLAERLHWYNALLRHRHGRRVRTVLFLLRPAADGPDLAGVFEQQFPGEPAHDVFRYQVVRVWQVPVQALLAGGLGTLPLAPISAVAEADLPLVVRQIDDRLQREASPEQAGVLTTAALVLTGLRLPREQAIQLFRGVRFMSVVKDSSVYEWFLEEGVSKGMSQGMIQGTRKVILHLGQKRFGPPDAGIVAALDAITDLSRLERMSERLLDAASWQEVLATS